jgi:hypothetical protein
LQHCYELRIHHFLNQRCGVILFSRLIYGLHSKHEGKRETVM